MFTNLNPVDIFDLSRSRYVSPPPDLSYFFVEIKPYANRVKAYLDIETFGLTPDCPIIAIGLLKDHNSQISPHTLYLKSGTLAGEIKMIECLFSHLDEIEYCFTYNGASFDIPFILCRYYYLKTLHPSRLDDPAISTIQSPMPSWLRGKDLFHLSHVCKEIGLELPVWIQPTPTKVPGATLFNQIIQFHQTYKKGCVFIDAYHLVLQRDEVARTLTSKTLKQVVLQWGLRKEARLELDYKEIQAAYHRGDKASITKYLNFDLDDTKLIVDKLFPVQYKNLEMFPRWNPQKLFYKGNGALWEELLMRYKGMEIVPFGEDPPDHYPTASARVEYQGAYTKALAGLFIKGAKIDIASMYPMIMLLYNIHSSKDKEGDMLILLNYLTQMRLKLKKSKDPADQLTQESWKPKINSAYGMLGTEGISFNDYDAAAMVTRYGRAITHFMEDFIQARGGLVFQIDTDGLFFHNPTSPSYDWNMEIYRELQAALPKGISIELEVEGSIFVPCSFEKGKKVAKKKNYIVVPKDPNGKILKKGIINKRNICTLQKFPLEFIIRYVESPELADAYYTGIRNQIVNGTYPIENLIVEKRIASNEKKLVAQLNRSPGDEVKYYYNTPEYCVEAASGKPYSIYHYTNMIDKLHEETLKNIDISEYIKAAKVHQLDLGL